MAMYVISDPHGFYNETIAALKEKGFDNDKNNRLILLGDVLDRGPDAVKLVDYLIGLLDAGRLILIRGNHEDLLEDALHTIEQGFIEEVASEYSHHWKNKTFKTLLQLSGMTEAEAVYNPEKLVSRVKNSPYYTKLLPAAIDYYETDNHIFTHGWIPCNREYVEFEMRYNYDTDWRNASHEAWRRARWDNGMYLSYMFGVVEKDKTIVCGHYHASYGHSRIEKVCSEFDSDADFSPYYGDGIIAIDGCVAFTKKVNCIVIED